MYHLKTRKTNSAGFQQVKEFTNRIDVSHVCGRIIINPFLGILLTVHDDDGAELTKKIKVKVKN